MTAKTGCWVVFRMWQVTVWKDVTPKAKRDSLQELCKSSNCMLMYGD